jgi:hypothetical protein
MMLPYLPLAGAAAGVLLFGLAVALAPFRRAARSLPPGALVGFHLVRAGGAAFVVLGRKSLLPPQIAERFGIGEVAVAILGAGVLWLLTMPLDRTPRSVVAWSAFGLINIAWFSFEWVGVALTSPDAHRLAAFPWVLYPAVVIPFAVSSHLELLRRSLRRS